MALFTDADIQARALALQQQAQAAEAARLEQERQAAEAARLAEANRSRTFGEVVGDTGAGALQSAMNLGGAAYGLANMATLGYLDRGLGLSENFDESNRIVEGWKSAPLQAQQAQLRETFDQQGVLAGAGELISNPALIGDFATQSAAYLLPGAALARGAAATTAARATAAGMAPAETAALAGQAATRAGLAAQSGQTAGYLNVDAINAAREAGRTPEEQQGYGLLAGGVGAVVGPAISKLTGAAALEARAATQAFGGTALPASVGNVATQVLGGAAREGVEEAGQETYETMLRNLAGDRPLLEGTATSATIGGVMGGLLGGVLGGVNVRRDTPVRQQLDAARPQLEAEAGAEIKPALAEFASSTAPVLNTLRLDAALDAPTPAPVVNVNQLNERLGLPPVFAADVPPVLDPNLEQRLPAMPPVLDTGALDQRLLQPADLPDVASVMQAFGPRAAAQEQARRDSAAQQQAEQARSALLADPKAHRKAVQTALEQAAGQKLSGQEVIKLATALHGAGVAPTDLEFNSRVGELVAARIAERPNSSSKVLGALYNAFPVDREQAAADAAFDAPRSAAISEEAIFGPEPTPAPLLAPSATVPAGTPTLLSDIARLGGIGTDYRTDILRDTAGSKKGYRTGSVFTKAGTSPDGMATAMFERGYITPTEYAEQGGVPRLYELIERSYAGEKIYPVGSPAYEAQLEQQAQVQAAEQVRVTQDTAALERATAESVTPVADLLTALDTATTLDEVQALNTQIRFHPDLETLEAADFNRMAAAVNRLTGARFELAETWYHGTASDITVFSASEDGNLGGGYYATLSPKAAAEFARRAAMRTGDTGANIMPLRVRAGRILDLDAVTNDELARIAAALPESPTGLVEFGVPSDWVAQGWYDSDWARFRDNLRRGEFNPAQLSILLGQFSTADVKAEILRKLYASIGYDAVARTGDALRSGETYREVVVFDPARLKSAVGNTGAFDPTNPDIRYRRGVAVNKPISPALFAKGVVTANNNLGIPVAAFDTVAALAADTGLPLPPTVKGMYHNGRIYVVRENIASAKDLAFTLAHETGHAGMERLLGASLRAATNRLWANAAIRERIKAKQAEGYSRADAGEEVLVDMLASGERLNASLWAKLRAGVRDFFARVFGLRGVRITNAEVDALLGDVARVLRGAPAAQVRAEMANPELWLTDIDTAVAQDPKFAKVKADLDTLLADAANEPEGKTLPLGHVVHAAAQASIDAAKRVGAALKENRLGSALMHNFMNLDNIVDWHDAKFGGRLRKLLNLKEARDAEFNRANAAQNELAFKTQRNGTEVTTELGKHSFNDVMEQRSEFRRSSPAKDALLDYALTDGTFWQVFPERSWEDQVHDGFDYEAKGYTVEQRRAAHAKLRQAWQQMGSTAQQLYMRSQSLYAQRFYQYTSAVKDEANRLGERAKADAAAKGLNSAETAAKVDAAVAKYNAAIGRMVGRVQQGPYSPLMRHGEHLLVVRDAKGTVVHSSAYDTKAEAEAAASEIEAARAESGETVTVTVDRPQQTDFDGAGIKRQEIEGLRQEMLDLLPAGMDPDVRDTAIAAITGGLAEAYLQALPAKAFAKHAISRKNVTGYDTDSLRAMANYAQRSARAVAGIKHDAKIAESLLQMDTYVGDVAKGAYDDREGVRRIDTAQLRDVANAVRNQHIAAAKMNESRLANAATGAAFLYQLTSPSHMLMNATQTPMVAFPRLAGLYGTGKASREISKAMSQFAGSGFDLLGDKSALRSSTDLRDGVLLDTLTKIRENGPLDLTQAHEASGVADGSSTELSPYWGKVLKALAYPMHKSEVFNRQVTASAAIRLELAKRLGNNPPPSDPAARDALIAALTRTGEEAIRTTQFNYARYNKGKIQQNPVGKVVMQYKTYQINMLSMIAKDIRDARLGKPMAGMAPMDAEEAQIARRTLAWTLGMQLALTGAAGTILAPFVFAALDAFKDDDDLTDSRTDFLNAMAQLGPVGEMASKGVFQSLLSMERVGADTLIPILGQRKYAPVDGKGGDTFMYYVTQNLGPAFGLGRNLATGTGELFNGNIEKAVGSLLPKPLADAHKALFDSQNGVRDARGIVYFEPSLPGTLSAFVGLQTGDRRDAEAARSAVYKANTLAVGIERRYLNRLALAVGQGDAAAVAEAQQDIAGFNAKYPDLAITGSDIRSAIAGRARAQFVAEQTGVVSSRLPGQTISGVAGL